MQEVLLGSQLLFLAGKGGLASLCGRVGSSALVASFLVDLKQHAGFSPYCGLQDVTPDSEDGMQILRVCK